ncbi:hypothetical protein JOQ06_015640, partial [Pogonophryne albipinna]
MHADNRQYTWLWPPGWGGLWSRSSTGTCVPGRSMVDNVHLIRDVLEVSSSLAINTGLISLDQEKAFDRVEHSFLWKVKEKFGFSAGFIAKIK